LPEGVTVTPVLEVPANFKSIWAEQNDGIGRISDALRTGENRGEFAADPKTTWLPPFSVILAAEKSFGQNEDKSRIVVMGNGESYADYYMTRRVPRFTGEGRKTRFMTDPPPTENAELFVNTVYWLNGQPGMIAEGPAAMPLVPALKAGTQTRVLAMTLGWALAVLVAGGVVLLVRRK